MNSQEQLKAYINSYFGIPESELNAVVDLFKEEDLAKGDFFCKKDHYCNKLSFVASGFLRVFKDSPSKEITQWISTQDYLITDLGSLVFNQPARWNIQALSKCQLFTIDKENYYNIGNHVPQWHILEKHFIAKCFLTLEDRVFQQLSMTAEEKYDALFEQNKALFNEVPLQYLASMLGMTPETLSRIRKSKTS